MFSATGFMDFKFDVAELPSELDDGTLTMIGLTAFPLCFVKLTAGTGGVPAGDDPFELTLTMAAFCPPMICVAGIGLSAAESRYIVEAILVRARLGAMLPGRRPSTVMDDISEYVESRRSPGINISWSENREFVLDGVPIADGIGGTGGTRISEPELPPERFVTPGMYAIWMMFEARVRTVDAMEATVCVDALDLASLVKMLPPWLFSIPSSSSSSHSSTSCLRPFNQNFHMQNTTIEMKATPPITPPTIAPMFGPEDRDGVLTKDPDVAASTQEAAGHVSQSPSFCAQISSDLQVGHAGASFGHGIQF